MRLTLACLTLAIQAARNVLHERPRAQAVVFKRFGLTTSIGEKESADSVCFRPGRDESRPHRRHQLVEHHTKLPIERSEPALDLQRSLSARIARRSEQLAPQTQAIIAGALAAGRDLYREALRVYHERQATADKVLALGGAGTAERVPSDTRTVPS